MKKKLYCFIGGCALTLPIVFYPIAENADKAEEIPVSKIYQEEAGEDNLVIYEACNGRENEAAPLVFDASRERNIILDYDALYGRHGQGYDSDLSALEKSSAEKNLTGKNQTEKKPAGENAAKKKTAGKKAAGKEPAGKKLTGKSSAGKSLTEKKSTEKKSKDKKSEGKNSKEKNPSGEKKGKDDKKKNKNRKKNKKTPVISLTREEKDTLLRIVEAEATGENVMGRMLVANVVLNRVKSEIFPDNVVDVVYAHSDGIYQFSPIRDGRFWQVQISPKTRRAVKRVLNGEDYSNGALFFMARRSARSSSVSWFDTHLTMVKQYGGHEFFK